jgi:hypothetical protein
MQQSNPDCRSSNETVVAAAATTLVYGLRVALQKFGVMKDMPIQRRSSSTYEEIVAQIRILEDHHGVSTDKFLTDCHNFSVDGDVAMEWAFLAEQRNAMLDAAVSQFYSQGFSATRLENLEPAPELLAA